MKTIFKSVKIKNFMSYENASVKLNRNGFILVTGINNNPDDSAMSNGTGKSSLFSAISWALTGLTVSGSKEVANILTDGKVEVELEFDIDDVSYVVRRTKNPSNLKFIVSGEDKSGKGIRDTEKILSEYLPDLTHSLLNSVIILGQGLPQRFTNNSPSGRKEVLEKLSNSDFMINDLKERVNSRESYIRDKLQNNTIEIAKYDTLIEVSKNEKHNSENEFERLNNGYREELNNKINLLNSECEKLNTEYNKVKSEFDSYSDNINLISDEISDYTQLNNEERLKLNIVDCSDLNQQLSELIAEINSLNREIKKLDNVTDICPTCGQKLNGVVKVDTTDLKNKVTLLENDKSSLVSKIFEINSSNKKISDEFDKKVMIEMNELRNKQKEYMLGQKNSNNKLMSISSELNVKSNEITFAESSLNSLDETILKCKEAINTCNLNIDKYTNERELLEELNSDYSKRLDIIKNMNTSLKRDFRGYLLSNVIEYISSRTKIYSMDLFGTENLTFELDGNNISISYDGKDYDVLSGGEKQKVDVIIQLSIRDMLCTFLNFSSNILVLDEITDNLDIVGSQKMFNLISTKLNDVEAVYIISHHTDFDIPYDDEIVIMKGSDKISRIM